MRREAEARVDMEDEVRQRNRGRERESEEVMWCDEAGGKQWAVDGGER